jgi:thiol-disulfide isomerase/thioredoxin
MLPVSLLVAFAPQQPAPPPPTAAPATIVIPLQAHRRTADERPTWEPREARIDLHREGDALAGLLRLGPRSAPPIVVRLARSPGQERFDRLQIDRDRDGKLDPTETLTGEAKLQRGSWWSTFETTIAAPKPSVAGAAHAPPYPIVLTHVAAADERAPLPHLRWACGGWFEGEFTLDGRRAGVLVRELVLDGVLDESDSWALAYGRKLLLAAGPCELGDACWLEERAFRCRGIDADGRELRIEPFDPRQAASRDGGRADRFQADRDARRAAAPLAFANDFTAAMERARRERKRVFVDFATRWCGPCKLMDDLVYTAADTVAAAADEVCVKVDGDVERALTKQFAVGAYPTLLLLDADGHEVRRAVGYQSVAAVTTFLGK